MRIEDELETWKDGDHPEGNMSRLDRYRIRCFEALRTLRGRPGGYALRPRCDRRLAATIATHLDIVSVRYLWNRRNTQLYLVDWHVDIARFLAAYLERPDNVAADQLVAKYQKRGLLWEVVAADSNVEEGQIQVTALHPNFGCISLEQVNGASFFQVMIEGDKGNSFVQLTDNVGQEQDQ